MSKDRTPTVLKYESPVVLVGGGDVDAGYLRAWGRQYPVIAVDSGADEARTLGLEPEAITGDMDSISSPDAFPRSRILPTPDQDQTDFAKALALVDAPLILCLGFLGRRFDHALAAINTLARARQDRIVLVGPSDAIVFRRGDTALQLAPGSRISIWPMGEQSFLGSEGLEWPLDGLCMSPGGAIGTSNRVARGDGEVRIKANPEGGGYLIITPVDAVNRLISAIAPEDDHPAVVVP
ncbi:thiamine diphosphokinase [Alphaproteobacteria bacterium LSUCC0684]